jgi:hypothetical protein
MGKVGGEMPGELVGAADHPVLRHGRREGYQGPTPGHHASLTAKPSTSGERTGLA